MSIRTRCLLLAGLALLATLAFAQRRRRDALTDAETDQLREVAVEPERRIKLFVKFARARMEAIEQVRSDAKFAEGRGKRLHDLLEDLSAIVDEMDQNIDEYDRQKADLRKALKEVVEADSEMQLKLRAIKEGAASDDKLAREAQDYKFILDDATESVNSSADTARETLQQEVEDFAKKDKEDKAKKKK